jgi:hypothetical protein
MNDIIIDYKKHLNIGLGGSIITNGLPCISAWVTVGSKIPNVLRTTLSNETPKIIIPTPTINNNRQLSFLKVNNYDTVSTIVLINVNSGDGTSYNMNLINVLLSPQETLFYTILDGFYIMDYNGKTKNIQNNIEVTPVTGITISGTVNLDLYYTKNESNLLLFDKSNIGHTHSQYLTGYTTGYTIDLNSYSLTGHTHTIESLSGVSTTIFNNYTGATNPHGITISQLSGVSLNTFTTYTATTLSAVITALDSVLAYASLYENNASGTTINVSNTGQTGWVTAVLAANHLTTLTKNSKSDRITILSGASGTFQIGFTANVSVSNTTPIYWCGIYKNNVLIPPAQSYISATNISDRYNFSQRTVITGVTGNDFFDVRFSSDNSTTRSIKIYNITFNMNRIGP